MVKPETRRLEPVHGLSDRDVLLARLHRIEELLARVVRIEQVQQTILGMLSADRRGVERNGSSPGQSRFLRRSDITSMFGMSRSTIYLRIEQRLFPRPIRLGARMVAWRTSEVVAIEEAQVRGASDEEIRSLVEVLEAARSSPPPE